MTDPAARRFELWLDVGSAYSYVAWRALPGFAERVGAWPTLRPMLLGGVFKATGNRSPVEVAAKGRWADADLRRHAARLGAPYAFNPWFPVNTLVPMRIAAGLAMREPGSLPRFLDACFDAIWGRPRDIADRSTFVAVLGEAGLDAPALLALAEDPEVKERLKRDTEEAVARGVFGAPTFFVGDEMFFGQDRMDFVADALATR
ncbi:MAG TPA: 2-hydroxychromene-2-carboxylate isomerase [Burkholderiaceae bacterium]|nr:2-hydroxychromene-2-carboxylate isomerase [Burkholderiaceae bacterium]